MSGGGSEVLLLIDSERARLRQMAAALASENDALREYGEARLEELATRLAKERAADVGQKRVPPRVRPCAARRAIARQRL